MSLRPVLRSWRLCQRCYASTTTPSSSTPPMLLKIRKDMKAAMQAKDTNRLAVLRSLLTQTINASKTSSPVTTDLHILALLRKNAAASRLASQEFRGAGRADLADKEDSQLRIMQEYAGSVETVSEEELRNAVSAVVAQMKTEQAKLTIGEISKRVFAPEALGGKPADRGEVVKLIKEVLAA